MHAGRGVGRECEEGDGTVKDKDERRLTSAAQRNIADGGPPMVEDRWMVLRSRQRAIRRRERRAR